MVTTDTAYLSFNSSQGSAKLSQGSGQSINKSGNSVNVNKTNIAQNQTNKIGSSQLSKTPSNLAKNNVSSSNKMGQQNFKSNQFCGTWNKGCFPTNYNCGWNYCSYGFGCWNPWYTRCYSPCYDYCCYPIYDYCYTTPVFYTCQPVEIVTTRVIEVVQQAPVVETVTTTQTTQATETAAVVKQPATDTSFLTQSALRR